MNTHDIELDDEVLEQIIRESRNSDGTLEFARRIARAAIEPYAKRIAQLEAARFAYASEFPPNEDGDPDVGSIHENIRKLKAELEADRQHRGEPVAIETLQLLKDARHRIANLSRAEVPFRDPLDGPVLRRLDAAIAKHQQQAGEPVDKGPWKAGVNRNDKRTFIESDDFTHDVRLYVDGDFADQDEKLAYALGIADQLNAASQPVKLVKRKRRYAQGYQPIQSGPLPPPAPQPAEPVKDGTPLGKALDGINSYFASKKADELVNRTDWNSELSSWSDEDFIRIFHERPDLASRLRKILAEPVKSLIDNQEPLGEEFQSVLDEHSWDLYVKNTEPVKVDAEASVSSNDLAHEIWAAAQTAPGESIEDAVERVAAILARYGQAAHQGGQQ